VIQVSPRRFSGDCDRTLTQETPPRLTVNADFETHVGCDPRLALISEESSYFL
jgi:hypothetical protein